MSNLQAYHSSRLHDGGGFSCDAALPRKHAGQRAHEKPGTRVCVREESNVAWDVKALAILISFGSSLPDVVSS